MYKQGLHSPLGVGPETKRKLKQVFCYKAGDEAEGLDLEESRRKSEDHLCASLAGVSICVLDIAILTGVQQ